MSHDQLNDRKIKMRNKMRYRKNCSGFTLVELVVVVAILAILMAMAVPQMIGYTKASHRMAGRTEAYLCVDAVQRYLDDEKEKGTLSAGKIVKLVNQELSNPDTVLSDYLYGGQQGAKLTAMDVYLTSGLLKSLTYESKYYTVKITIDKDGKRTRTNEVLK